MSKRTPQAVTGSRVLRPRDEWDTPPEAVAPLLQVLPERTRFIEPCAGEGALIDALAAHGHECAFASDIAPRREGIVEMDGEATMFWPAGIATIITNPPYTRQVFLPLLDAWMDAGVESIWMLVPLDWTANLWFAPYLHHVPQVVPVGRVSWLENGKSGYENYTWLNLTPGRTHGLLQSRPSRPRPPAPRDELPDRKGNAPVNAPALDAEEALRDLRVIRDVHDLVTIVPDGPVTGGRGITDMRFSTGLKTGTRWTTSTLPLADFLARLVQIDPGSNLKEGTAWSPADLGDQPGARTNDHVLAICALCLDVDDGTPEVELREKLGKLGLRALAFSTYSHLATTTEVKLAPWQKRPSGETAEAFLQRVKHLRPEIAAGAKVVGQTTTTITFEHNPCPRWRVVFPLAEPFEVASHGGAAAAGRAWKRLLQIAAGLVGVVHDTNAADLARMFFDRRVRDAQARDHAVHFEVVGKLWALGDPQAVPEGADVPGNVTPRPAPRPVLSPPATQRIITARVEDYPLIAKMFREMPNPDLGDNSWIATAGALKNSMPEDIGLAEEIFFEWEARFERGSDPDRARQVWETSTKSERGLPYLRHVAHRVAREVAKTGGTFDPDVYLDWNSYRMGPTGHEVFDPIPGANAAASASLPPEERRELIERQLAHEKEQADYDATLRAAKAAGEDAFEGTLDAALRERLGLNDADSDLLARLKAAIDRGPGHWRPDMKGDTTGTLMPSAAQAAAVKDAKGRTGLAQSRVETILKDAGTAAKVAGISAAQNVRAAGAPPPLALPADDDEAPEGASFDDPARWEHPVDGAALADEIAAMLSSHVMFPSTAEAVALTLWTLGTYFMGEWRLFPKVLVRSPVKRCGKSTLLEAIEPFVRRAKIVSNMSAAALFRSIDLWGVALLLDEADTYLRDNPEANGIINCGHTRRTANVTRVVEVDGNLVPRDFSVWAPQVIAGIGDQRDTLTDRSIIINLKAATDAEKMALTRLPKDHYERHHDTRRKLKRWARDNRGRIDVEAQDKVVPILRGNSRAKDNWEPLFAIAEALGGDWPLRVGMAHLHMQGTGAASESAPNVNLTLLRDVMAVFRAMPGEDAIQTGTVLGTLVAQPERGWGTYRGGHAPISAHTVSRMLGDFGIQSRDKKVDGKGIKHFFRDQVEDAYRRYCPEWADEDALAEPVEVTRSVFAGEIPPFSEGIRFKG